MRVIKNLSFIIVFLFVNFLFFSEDPIIIMDESLKDDNAESETVSESKYNVKYQKQNGYFYQGFIENNSGYYLQELTWEDNKTGNQQILIDFVKSIYIKGYRMQVKKFDNISMVFYFPHIFDIELTNGKVIKKATGRIPQIESFLSYNELGQEKCYTYFGRYWLEDKKMFLDNNSTDIGETPDIPEEVITFIEFEREK